VAAPMRTHPVYWRRPAVRAAGGEAVHGALLPSLRVPAVPVDGAAVER
jgi:hypothetical protein